MKPEYYLLSFAVSGIKNIEKEIKLEFYNKTMTRNFDPKKYRVKAIYGENGAGKTAIVSAAMILRRVILNTSYLGDSANQKKLNELINKKTKCLKLEAEFTGRLDNEEPIYVYRYFVELCKDINGKYCITKESLCEKKGSYSSAKYNLLFESVEGELRFVKADEEALAELTARTQNLLEEKSFIGMFLSNLKHARNMDLDKDLIRGIINALIFTSRLSVCIEDTDQHDMYYLAEELKAAKKSSDKENDIDKLLDKSILQVELMVGDGRMRIHKSMYKEYAEEVKKLESFLKLFKNDLVSIDIEKREDGDYYETSLVMDYGEYQINTEFESNGIKKLFKLFNYINYAAAGGIVFIDEMDSNINDIYLTKLVEFFMEYGEGQLCFTTHNTSPMSVLRRNKKSIDFLSNDNRIISWRTNGNFAPDKLYKQGMIEYLPFNIEPEDFVGILGDQA